jgi:uncharacterized membrane protein YebE (DUF533 family)
MEDAGRLLHRLVDTGFGGYTQRAAAAAGAPGAPMEGPRGSGAGSTRFAGLMEWLGESLMEDKSPKAAGAAAPFESETDGGHALLLIRAMVAAARADGRIDPAEEGRILRQLDEAGASPGERALIERELREHRPFDPALQGVDDPRLAERLYAASAMVLDADRPAERRYLLDLARRLQLPAATVVDVHRRLGTAVPE